MPKYNDIKKVLVIGSGPIVIGQAAEFDYAGTQACLALKEEGIEVLLVNNNPATIMTDESVASKVYMEPLTIETIERIIKKEKPDGLIGSLGGQTGLNLTVQLYEKGILEKNRVKLLGTSAESIQKGEDREKFRSLMLEIGEPVPDSEIVENIQEGMEFVRKTGYPVIIRPAYTLGGAGGGFAGNDEEYLAVLKRGLGASPIGQVLVEKSIKGWKEIEYEVMRDVNDTCTIVCNMENMDPVGVHTGDSIVTAPSQTLTDSQYQMLRNASLKVIRALDVVGGCNIQFALNPDSDQYFIIEVNPRVSRSSALASKATGYPIARIAAKCAIGYHLDEIINPVTGNTFASFEPALDYVVVKLPRFPFDKFSEGDRTLGTQMKATGEVMAIDRSFEGAFNKAVRSLEVNNGHSMKLDNLSVLTNEDLLARLSVPTDLRIYELAEAFYRKISLDTVHEATSIDKWFLWKIKRIIDCEIALAEFSSLEEVPLDLIKTAKKMNISDKLLSRIFQVKEKEVRTFLKSAGMKRSYKLVDTCAAEFDAETPYFYSTWHGADEAETNQTSKKVLVIGSGPIRIGQGVEFDYCSVHAAEALKKAGYEAIVINNNPETVSTDYSVADRLYFEPLAAEDILAVAEKEQVEGALIQFGGQTAINVAEQLAEEGIQLLGTSLQSIDELEDREKFYQLLNNLNIPHIAGETVKEPASLYKTAAELGYPVLVRPSYVIGGQSMFVCSNQEELKQYIERITAENDERSWPVLVDQFLPGMECEMDVISDGETIVVPGIFEHLEKAGVHSGDSTAFYPPLSITLETKNKLVSYAEKIAEEAAVKGMINIQFVVYEETVYVLEVNPRASRTVPIISKLTGIPMIDWSVRVQLGEKLSEITGDTGLLPEPDFYSVKVPVYSAGKLKGVDHVAGPEMKSTGEVLALGFTKEEALQKSLAGISKELAGTGGLKRVFCTITDGAKLESLPLIEKFADNEFELVATEGTAEFLKVNGFNALAVSKQQEELEELFKTGELDLVINIPTQGRVQNKAGFTLRELAVKYQIPCFTSLQALEPVISQLGSINGDMNGTPRALNEYAGRLITN